MPVVPSTSFRFQVVLSSCHGVWHTLCTNARTFACGLQGIDLQSVLDDIRKLKIIVKGHERRIKGLEEKVTFYEKKDCEI